MHIIAHVIPTDILDEILMVGLAKMGIWGATQSIVHKYRQNTQKIETMYHFTIGVAPALIVVVKG